MSWARKVEAARTIPGHASRRRGIVGRRLISLKNGRGSERKRLPRQGETSISASGADKRLLHRGPVGNDTSVSNE